MKRPDTNYSMLGQKYGRLTIQEIAYKDKKRTYLKVICDCGKENITRADGIKNGKIISCGCTRRSKTEDILGSVFGKLTVISFSHVYKGNSFVNVVCSCGTEKVMRAASLLEGKTFSCGCYRKEEMTGANSWSWKGGISPEHDSIRASTAYKKWRKQVLSRDNYACQKCSNKQNLQVHHLFDFANYPDNRFSIDNGAVLCETCHISFHKIYGKHNTNNIHQYYAFLGQ